MTDTRVAIINGSTVLTDEQVRAVVPALQAQVHNDFAPAWGIDAILAFVPKGSPPPAGAWWLVLLDTSDQAGALGYHDVTDQWLPLGKVFVATDLQNGLEWTATASHELLEMLVDPDINLTVFVQPDPHTGRLYAYEVCDACEADQFGYKIGGIFVSDFVLPAWFQSSRPPGSTKFDHQRHVQKPFELLPGGYIGVFDVGSGTGWYQLYPQLEPHTYHMRPRVGSRRERRRTPRDQWLKESGEVSFRVRWALTEGFHAAESFERLVIVHANCTIIRTGSVH